MARRKIEENYEEVKQKIIAAAIQMLIESEFSKFTLTGVAERIGVTKAAIYWYFPSKDKLIEAVAVFLRHAYISRAQEIAAGAESACRKLKRIFCETAGQEVYMCVLPVKLFLEYYADEHPVKEQICQSYQEFIAIVADILEDGIRAGVFNNQWPAVVLARSIVAAMDGSAVHSMMLSEGKNHSEAAFELFLSSIRAEGAQNE